jgi:diguanylate cyclase (GGDEF)-like protein
MPVKREQQLYRRFILSTSLVIGVVLLAIFLNMATRTRELMSEDNLIKARVVFNTIAIARKWNADYGGVYVEKKPGVLSSPYLRDPDIALDGKIYTKRNHAVMTRELSEYAAREGVYHFHLTSLKQLNPANKPDAFETEALQRFERGAREVSRTEIVNNRTYFRYMAPLYVEKECLQCHGQQGYKVGDVRGGISVSFDIENQLRSIRRNTFWIVLLGVASVGLLLGLVSLFTTQLIRKLAEARTQIEMIAITDHLTGLYNRRHLLARFHEEFEKARRLDAGLCCIMADIDHFKAVNDRFGHLAGDEVLKTVAQLIRNMVRAYDIVGRYGGEEFLIILPDTDLADARHLAERMRLRLKDLPTQAGPLTMSLGVAAMEQEDRVLDDIIKRADERMYAAKNAGRDRIA